MNSVARGKTTIRVDLLKRTLCLMIAGIFTFTSTIGAAHVESSFWSQRQEHINRSTIKSDASPILDLSSGVKGILHELPDGSTVNFPANSGTVVETFRSASANPLVIHIQDVHNHPDAQLNEAFLIQSLLESSNFLPSLRGAERRSNLKDDDAQLLICIEGAKGIVPTRSLASLPDAEAKKEVAYSYLREGKINGEEYVALTQPANKVIIYGVEDWNIYNANFAAREKVRQVSPAALAQVDNLLKQIKRAEAGKYSMELRELVSKRRSYHTQELELPDYLKYLNDLANNIHNGRRSEHSEESQASTYKQDTRPFASLRVTTSLPNIARVLKISQLESKLDSDKLEYSLKTFIEGLSEKLAKKEIESLLRKSLALRQGSISQSAYYAELFGLAGKNSIVIPGLLNEYREYQTLHSQLSYEKLMDEIDGLEENIANNLATTDEAKELFRYTDYVELLKDFWSLELTPKQWDKYKVRSQNDTLPMDLPDPKPVKEYYKLAEARNETLAKNTLAAAKKYGVKRTVLIAGGFHSDGMNKWFHSAGVPFIVIQPKLQKPANTLQPMKITFVNDLAAVAKEVKAKNRGNIASFRDLENMLNEVLRSEMGMAIIGRTMLRAEDINILLKEKIGSKDVEFTGDIIKVDVDLGSYKDAYVFGKAKYQYSAGEVIMAPAIIYGSGREMKIAVGEEAVKVLLSGLSVSAAKQIKAQAKNIEVALGVSGVTELISNISVYSAKGMLKAIKNTPQTISKIIKLATERLPNLLVYSGLKDKYLGKAVKSLSGLINKDNWHRLLTKPAMVSALAGFAVQMLVGIALGLLSNAHAFGLYGENGLISWDNKNWIIGVPVALFVLFILLKERGFFQGRSRRSGGGRISGTAGSFFKRVSGWNYFFGGTGVDVDMRNVELPEEIEMPYIEYETKIEAGKEKQVPKGIANEKRKIPELLKGFFQHVRSGARNGQARGWIERKDAKGKLNRLNLPMDWVEIVDQDEEIQIGPDLRDSKTGKVLPNTGRKISVANVVNGINDFYRDLRLDNFGELKNIENIVVIGVGGSSIGAKTLQAMLANNWRNRIVRWLWRHQSLKWLAQRLAALRFGSPFNVRIIDDINPRTVKDLETEINGRVIDDEQIYTRDAHHPAGNYSSINPERWERTLLIVSDKVTSKKSATTFAAIDTLYQHFKQRMTQAIHKTEIVTGDSQKEEVGKHFIAITERSRKDNPLGIEARDYMFLEERYTKYKDVFSYPYNITGGFTAMSVLDLLPARLMGIRIDDGGWFFGGLLRSAKNARMEFLSPQRQTAKVVKSKDGKERLDMSTYSDGVKLGILMAKYYRHRNKMTFILPEKEEYRILGLWLNQLIGSSLGKARETGQRLAIEKQIAGEPKKGPSAGEHVGIVPIVNEPVAKETSVFDREDRFFVRINEGLFQNRSVELSRTIENYERDGIKIEKKKEEDENDPEAKAIEQDLLDSNTPVIDINIRYKKNIGAFMYTMEVAVAVAGYLMDINPFEEDIVEDSPEQKFESMLQDKLEKREKKVEQLIIRRLGNSVKWGNDYNAGTPYAGIDIDVSLLLSDPDDPESDELDNRWASWENIDMVLERLLLSPAERASESLLPKKDKRILREGRRINLAAVYAALLYLARQGNAPHFRDYAVLVPYLPNIPGTKGSQGTKGSPGTEGLINNWRSGVREVTGLSTLAEDGSRFAYSLLPLARKGTVTGLFTFVREFDPERLHHRDNLILKGVVANVQEYNDNQVGRRFRDMAINTAENLRDSGRGSIMINLKRADSDTITRLDGLFSQAHEYVRQLLLKDREILPHRDVVNYRGVSVLSSKVRPSRATPVPPRINLLRTRFGRGSIFARLINRLRTRFGRGSIFARLINRLRPPRPSITVAPIRVDGVPNPDRGPQAPQLGRMVNLAIQRGYISYHPLGWPARTLKKAFYVAVPERLRRNSARYEIRVVDNLNADAVKQVDATGHFILLDRTFVETLLAQDAGRFSGAAIFLLGEAVNHAMHHRDVMSVYDFREWLEELFINLVYDLPLHRRLQRHGTLSNEVGEFIRISNLERTNLKSEHTFASLARKNNPVWRLRLNPFRYLEEYMYYVDYKYRFNHKVETMIPTHVLRAASDEVDRLIAERSGMATAEERENALAMHKAYDFMLDTFHNGSRTKMFVSMLRERGRTGRSFRDMLLGLTDASSIDDDDLPAEVVRIGGGGEADTELSKELMSGKKRESIWARRQISKFSYYVVTSVFDDGGHSGRMMLDFMQRLGLILHSRSPGDPGAVLGWMADHPAIKDLFWGTRLTARLNPDSASDKQLLAVLGAGWQKVVKQKVPDAKGEDIDLIRDVIKTGMGFDDSIREQVQSTFVNTESVTSAEELLKEKIKEIYKKHFGSRDLPVTEGWHYVISSMLRIMRYYDDNFFSKGYMRLIGVSVTNLVYEYAANPANNVDLRTLFGIYGGAVRGVTMDEATLAAELEAHTVRIGNAIFLVKATDGTLEVAPAQEIQPDTEELVVRGEGEEMEQRPIGTTRMRSGETWSIEGVSGMLKGKIAGGEVSFTPTQNGSFEFKVRKWDENVQQYVWVTYDEADIYGNPIANGIIPVGSSYTIGISQELQKKEREQKYERMLNVYLVINNKGNGKIEITPTIGSEFEASVPITMLDIKDRNKITRIYEINNGRRVLRSRIGGYNVEFQAVGVGGNDVRLIVNGKPLTITEDATQPGETIVEFVQGTNLLRHVVRTDALWDASLRGRFMVEKDKSAPIYFKSRLVKEQTFISDADDMLPASVKRLYFVKAKQTPDGKWKIKTDGSGGPIYDRLARPIREFGAIDVADYPRIDPVVRKKIENAKVVLLGLGSHFDSMLPNLLVDGLIEAVLAAKENGAHIVFVPKPTIDIQTAGLTLMDQIKVIEDSVNYMWARLGKVNPIDPGQPFRFTDIITHVWYAHPDLIDSRRKEADVAQKNIMAKMYDPNIQADLRTGKEKLSKVLGSLGITKIGNLENGDDGIKYLETALGHTKQNPRVIGVNGEKFFVNKKNGRMMYHHKVMKQIVNGHKDNAKAGNMSAPVLKAAAKSVFNALSSAVGYGLLAMVVGGVLGGHFDFGNANVFSLFGYTFNALGMMAGLVPASLFGFQAARISWAISNAKAGRERGSGVLIPEFESADDLPEPSFRSNGNRVAQFSPSPQPSPLKGEGATSQVGVYKPAMKQLSLTEQYWYYYHEKVHGFFGRLPGQEALVVLTDFVTWIPAIWQAHKAQVITIKKANKLLNAFEPAIIGDERNLYSELGEVEKYIVNEQTRLEVKAKETFNISSKLKNARQRLEKTYDLRAKFLNLGLVSNHTHTNEAADDGLYTPAALVEHARQNNITVLYVTGHNTMEGGVKAAEYIKAKGYLMDIRIAAEIDAPFEDAPYDEGKPGTGPYGYMHWIVIAQDDEVAINKMRDLTREIDSRLEPNLKRLFTRIFFLADKEKFSALTANIMQEQWQNWGKFLQGKGLIENGYSVEGVQKIMYGWFKELAEFASRYPEKTPAANGRRMLNKLNILGKWSGQVWGDEEETPRSVPMRELMTILYPDGVFEQETGIKAMRAEEIAQKYTDLGALVIVSHPQFEIGVIKTVTEGQVINHVVSMVKSGTIKGMGGGWWKQGREYTEKLAERISSEAGQEVFQVGSNPDFHGTGDDIQRARNFGQGWALEGLKPDRARHFKDGEFLSRQYVEKVKKLLSEFYDITDAEVRDGLRNDIFNLARIAAATDPYGKAPRKLIQQIHKTLIKDYKDKRSVYETIISNPIVMLTTAVSLIAKFVLTLVGGSFLVGMVAQQEPGEITSIKTATGLLDNIVPVKIGDERNLYEMLGIVEEFIVTEQKRVEMEVAKLEDEFINAPSKEEYTRLATVLVAKRTELKDIYTARSKFIKLGLPSRHTHTDDDDGKYSAEELVEHARNNNITVLYVTGHNTMDGYLKAAKYIEEKGYLMDVRPGVEIDAPFEDTPYQEGVKNSGPYAYMHFLVIGPSDEETIKKMQELTKDIDARFEIHLEEYFKFVYLLADKDYFNEAVKVVPTDRWLKWGKDLESKNLVQNGQDVDEVKGAMMKWFQEVVDFVNDEKNREKTPLGKDKRWLGKLNVLGNWTDQIPTWGDNASAIRRPMRDLMSMLFSDGMIEETTKVRTMRAEEMAQRFTTLGAIVIVAHPDFEVNTLRSITEEQLLPKIIGMVKAGTIKGIGGGWWKKGWGFTAKLVEVINRVTGQEIYQEGSNPDFHGTNDDIQRAIRIKGGEPWGLEELTPDRERYFKDGESLSGSYVEEGERLLALLPSPSPLPTGEGGRRSGEGEGINMPNILQLARTAIATDQYGESPRQLVQKIYEKAGEIRQVTSKGVLKTALYFMAAAALTGIMAYLFGQDTGVVKLAIPIILATMGGGLGLVGRIIGKAESGRLGKPSPEQVRKVVAELSQRFPGVVIKEAEAGKGITYEQGGDLYVNYESLAGLSPVVRQLIYSHEAMHLTNIPVVRSEFAAYLRLAIGLPMEIVKHHLKVVASQTHARLGSDVKAGLETLVALLSFRGHAYPAVDYKTVDINPDNLGIAEKVKQAAPSIDIEASKGVTGRLGEISTVLPQVVGSYLAQIGLEVKGVAVNPASLVSHYKSGEVPTLSAQVIVAGPSDMKPLLVAMDTQQLNSQLSFKLGEIKLTLLSDEFMKGHVNDSSRNRELFVHMKSMVSISGASFTNEDQGKLYGKAYVARARTLYNGARRTLNTTNKGLVVKAADVVAKLNELDFVLQAATGVDGIGIAANVKSLVRQAMVTGKWAPSERMLGELKGNMASAGKAIEAASRYVKLQNKLEGRVKKIMSLSAGLEDKDDRNKQERSGPGAFAVDSPVGFAWTAPWVEGMIMQNIVPQIVAEAKKGNLAIIPIVTDGDGEPLVFKTDEMYLVDDRTKKVITAISDALRASAETETDTEVRTRLLAVSNQFVLVPEDNVKEANGLLNQEKLHDILLHMPALRTLGLSKEFPLHMYSPAMPGKGQRWIDIQKSYLQMFLMVTPITLLDVGQHSKEAMEIYKMLAEQA